MTNKRSFVLPTGLGMSVEEGTLSIEFDGDVVLEDTLGYTLGSVKAGGDLTIAADSVAGNLSAGGDLSVSGDVTGGEITAGGSVAIGGAASEATITAGDKLSVGGDVSDASLAAADITLGAGEIKAKAIAATRSIKIGDAKLTVDVLQAPKVQLGKGATGRVTVIDAAADPGPSKIKGGFSLQDYEEMFGDAAAFLTERGLTPLGEDAAAPADDADEPEAEEDPQEEASAAEVEVVEEEALEELEPEIEELELEEETEMLNPDDLEPVEVEELPPAGEAGEEELRTKLEETLATIDSCYEGDAPPALASLRELVEKNDFTGLREDINGIWNELLKYHQKKRLRPPHQVTHAFNTIHSLIQNS